MTIGDSLKQSTASIPSISRQLGLPVSSTNAAQTDDSPQQDAPLAIPVFSVMSSGQDPPILLILVGLPGSGKTTFSEALVSQSIGDHRKWIRASQDDAPNRRRQECEAIVRQALQEGHNVVVDRVDFDPVQRSHFINIAYSIHPQPTIYALTLSVSQSTLERRLEYRPDHPTIPDLETGLRVLRQMRNQYRPPLPTEAEGFDRIFELPERDQPSDGIWTSDIIEEVLKKVENEGAKEIGERKILVSQNGSGGYHNYNTGHLSGFGRGRGRGRSDGDSDRGRGGRGIPGHSRGTYGNGNRYIDGYSHSRDDNSTWNRGTYQYNPTYRGKGYNGTYQGQPHQSLPRAHAQQYQSSYRSYNDGPSNLRPDPTSPP
ncbi:hypothetical protein L486_01838 [Kwoniella mangroviensis CBS 10435]|uniref:Uncharacterized protein n=1 Tax=Kwoniella mangroviensis CBS 10435 TaxID=1331196 RepID=A0A1B9J309_9TREE|nr:hypothetical protein L486_01838 [Kwoniella mangroviensis CBS 10435]OCF73259.1 hypothetical protein I204_06490 [Kwoniella mangroviensis CBS 8886]